MAFRLKRSILRYFKLLMHAYQSSESSRCFFSQCFVIDTVNRVAPSSGSYKRKSEVVITSSFMLVTTRATRLTVSMISCCFSYVAKNLTV